jgi:hypothetical protein
MAQNKQVWEKVTSHTQVKLWDRVRYFHIDQGVRYDYGTDDSPRFVVAINGHLVEAREDKEDKYSMGTSDLFGHFFEAEVLRSEECSATETANQVHSIERTRYPQKNPSVEDTFTRATIIQYLEEIPLGYKTEQEHKVTEELIARARRHFAELDVNWKKSID